MPQETDVSDDPDGLEATADRLEAALDRIARHMDVTKSASPMVEITCRLDGLIARIRDALGNPPNMSGD